MPAEPVAARARIRPARRWEQRLYRTVRAIIFGFARVFWRIEIIGREHLPIDRPFVLAPVHRSNVDFALVSLLHPTRMRYIAKDSLWKIAVLGRLWDALGAFPVHRGTPDRAALRSCVEAIEGGEPLVLFPEGTRQIGPLVQECFDGAAYVSSRTGAPIVPVGIGGSEASMPKGAKMLRPVKIVVVVGPALDPPAAAEGGRAPRRAVSESTARLQTEVQRLFDEASERAGRPNRR
jgi:1-acyl-sn-glycerol-3-phosphate acyltransferase